MKSREDYQFEVLIKELDYADKQISTSSDLQMKILGIVFTVLASSLGLFLTSDTTKSLNADYFAKILVIISTACSFGVVQSTLNVGFAIVHIHNKLSFIAPRLKLLLGMNDLPLQTFKAYKSGPARYSIVLSTLVLTAGIFLLNVGVLLVAWMYDGKNLVNQFLIAIGAIFLVCSLICQIAIYKAMQKVGVEADVLSASNPESVKSLEPKLCNQLDEKGL